MYSGERRGPVEHYSGRLYEQDCLGEPVVDEAFKRRWDMLPRRQNGQLQRFEDLYDLVKEAQREDPTDPRKPFARDVRLAVAEAMNLDDKSLEGLKFYTAVGTPLDIKHGVDGFIELEDQKTGRRYRVTMDLTMNKGKVETGHKADIIIGELTDMDFSMDRYLDEIDDYGKRIASIIDDRRKSDEIALKRDGRNARPKTA